jgi:hypothetical protein
MKLQERGAGHAACPPTLRLHFESATFDQSLS